MRINFPPRPERKDSKYYREDGSSTSRFENRYRKPRRRRYKDDSSIVSSSTPLPIEPSPGMVLDANGNDIGQALAMKVNRSALRVKDNQDRLKVKKEQEQREESMGSWISQSLSNMTFDFTLNRNNNWESKTSHESQRGRVVKETLIGDPTISRVQLKMHLIPKKNTYMPSKYIPHERYNTSRDESLGSGLFGLFGQYACDGRQDIEDTDSTYTAHRDDRGAIIYEV